MENKHFWLIKTKWTLSDTFQCCFLKDSNVAHSAFSCHPVDWMSSEETCRAETVWSTSWDREALNRESLRSWEKTQQRLRPRSNMNKYTERRRSERHAVIFQGVSERLKPQQPNHDSHWLTDAQRQRFRNLSLRLSRFKVNVWCCSVFLLLSTNRSHVFTCSRVHGSLKPAVKTKRLRDIQHVYWELLTAADWYFSDESFHWSNTLVSS